MILCFCIMLLFYGNPSQTVYGEHIVTVFEGDDASLTCNVEKGESFNLAILSAKNIQEPLVFLSGQECKNISHESCSRCNLTCDWTNWSFTLTVRNVTLGDNKTTYIFQVNGNMMKNITVIVKDACEEVLLEPNENVILRKNESVTLQCDAKCSSNVSFTWNVIKYGEKTPRVRRTSKVGKELVYSFEEGGATIFCEAIDWRSARTFNSNRISVAIGYKPCDISFNDHHSEAKTEINLVEQDNIYINCTADCTPICQYKWENDKEIFDTAVLKMENITRNETGNYTCIASNDLGNMSKTLSVNVLYASRITHIEGRTSEIHENQGTTIDCIVEGNPKPSLEWSRHDSLLSKSSMYAIKEASCNDSGQYVCSSYNRLGNDTRQISLYVHCRPRITQPKVKTISMDSLDNLTLHVYYNAYPSPNTTLYFYPYNYTSQFIDITDDMVNVINHTFWHVATISTGNVKRNGSGRFILEIRNYLGVDFLEIVERETENKKINLVTLVSTTIPVVALCLLITVLAFHFLNRRKESNGRVSIGTASNRTNRSEHTGPLPEGYDGRYRTNSLYIPFDLDFNPGTTSREENNIDLSHDELYGDDELATISKKIKPESIEQKQAKRYVNAFGGGAETRDQQSDNSYSYATVLSGFHDLKQQTSARERLNDMPTAEKFAPKNSAEVKPIQCYEMVEMSNIIRNVHDMDSEPPCVPKKTYLSYQPDTD